MVCHSDRNPSSPSKLFGLRSDFTRTQNWKMAEVSAKFQSDRITKGPIRVLGVRSEHVGQCKDLAMATPIPMPTRNECTAPKFDTSRPRELPRFFEDLEDLMTRAQIALDTDKKKQAVRYTDFETEQIWKAVPEFKDNTKTYDDFNKAIMQ